MNLLFTALIVVWAAWLILKKYKPQTVLFVAGGLLLAGSMIMNWGTILPAGKSTGMWSFDIFELIRTLFANRLSGLGLNIMAVGGFARYMDKIGASNALVALTIRPLMLLKSPYIVMSACWVLGMFLGLAINSASGLAMLLMVTMFPILVALGVSRISATAAIATTLCLDWSPSDTGTIFAAEIAASIPSSTGTPSRSRSPAPSSPVSPSPTTSHRRSWISATGTSCALWIRRKSLSISRLRMKRKQRFPIRRRSTPFFRSFLSL